MPVQLNHTIVAARDRHESASFLSEILGLKPPTTYGPFAVVELDNEVSLDFIEDPEIHQRHYAFLVSEAEFDEIFARIRERELPYWADPFEQHPHEINTNDGGRGVYWSDPNGHKLEILTVPYGGWPQPRP
jgi:catechol 2,3-dioxygenase-like lactoylglutathione lyase family enzyme